MDPGAVFDAFVSSSSFTKIQQLFHQLCALLDIDPHDSINVYKGLRSKLTDWKAKKLWSQLDRRADQKEYCDQKACSRLNILVIGAGPCGLRSAIECALLGARVILVEQRDKFSRNNVLHIWPFVIQDLKNLGIKIFYPTFCRGSIDHISIRQLQCVLLKVALVLGVQIHDSVSFKGLIFPEPDEHGKASGWRVSVEPENHILSECVFDALIGADGKRNTVPGFPKREMRGKLAIGITANFVNQRTPEEEKVQEISGVAYIFNQQFFKDMKEATGADLENIVYYKDETHYFVMCAKKQSLVEKGVIIEDNEDVSLLLSPSNVNQEKLCEYAASAADFATGGKLPQLKFSLNHNGKEDVAMFDFTSLFSAQCSVRLVERFDQRLLMGIVGDTLHEPFWPTGSGCARGFLGVLDTAWMLRSYGLNKEGLMVMLAERESAYRLLAQTTSGNLHKQLVKYTIDPRTRYISLETTVQPHEVSHLVDTDNPRNVQTNTPLPLRLIAYPNNNDAEFRLKYKLWRFCQHALMPYKLKMYNFTSCWDDGRALSALLGKFRPDAFDYISLCSLGDPDAMIKKVTSTVMSELGIDLLCENLTEWKAVDEPRRVQYLASIVDKLREDSKRMRDLLVNSIRTTAASHKRKAHAQVDASRAKKSEPIQQRASELLNALASTSVAPTIRNVGGLRDRVVDDFLEGRHEAFDEQEIREALSELNDDDSKRKEREERHERRLKEINDRTDFKMIRRKMEGENVEEKQWTKRPLVDKLNPERLFAVEKIVTGEVEAEKVRELYKNKRRQANILTRKMDKKDIDDMESKLEQTGMGVLFNKEQYRVLSSKEQKIMSVSAAAARQMALDGFKADRAKYKDIDERLTKADNLLKNQNLAGVDTVSKLRMNGALNSPQSSDGMLSSGSNSPRRSPKRPPPTPPKRITTSVILSPGDTELRGDDLVKLRPEETTTPSNRRPVSMPVLEMSYESVNARRQHNCKLCLKPVYLAERMQVEGMFIHRKCFRCAFCGQPLRLGHCAQDRNLEKFNPKFYCMQHINVSVFDKVAKIQKLASRSTKPSSFTVLLSPISPSDNVSMQNAVPQSADSEKTVSPKLSEVKDLNSPAALLEKTLEKMRAQREASQMGGQMQNASITTNTPERVEFETFKRNLRADLKSRKEQQQITLESDTESEHDDNNDIDEYHEAVSSCESTASDDEPFDADNREVLDEASSSDEDEFVEADLEELEKTVVANIDNNLNQSLTQEQAIQLLRSFNLRRTPLLETPERSPAPSSPGVFVTPQTHLRSVRSPSADAYYSPQAEGNTPFLTPLTTPLAANRGGESAGKSVRERALMTLESLREKARIRARLKSDEELGLRGAKGDRMSMPPSMDESPTSRPLKHRHSLREYSRRFEYPESLSRPVLEETAEIDTPILKSSPTPPVQTVQSTSSVKPSSVPVAPYQPAGNGLLARLFAPDPSRLRKAQTATAFSVEGPKESQSNKNQNNDQVAGTSRGSSQELQTASSESQKEASILNNSSGLKKVRRHKLNSPDSSGSGERVFDFGDDISRASTIIPRATVAPMQSPSPKERSDPHRRSSSQPKSRITSHVEYRNRDSDSPSDIQSTSMTLSVNEKNIKRIQKRADQIAKQKEQERVRTAQDIQRALQETEIRKAEVTSVGSDLERRLRDDHENRWVLEQWLLYVHEMEQLKLREDDLLRRVSEMEAVDEYKRLQSQLSFVQSADGGIQCGGSSHAEKDLLKRMLAAIEKRDAIQHEIHCANSRRPRSVYSDPQTLLTEKGASYTNFDPVFL